MGKDIDSHSLPHQHHEDGCLEEIQHEIGRIEDFQTVADTFKLLDDNTRLRIFFILCHAEECVINIAAMMDMSTPAVSHHLKLLKNANLISSRREGKEVYYKASDSPVTRNLHHYIENIMDIVCPK